MTRSIDINMTERYGSNVGIWQSSMGINAVTKEMHTDAYFFSRMIVKNLTPVVYSRVGENLLG